jgi:hypothetical protein
MWSEHWPAYTMKPSFQLETSGTTCEGETSWLTAAHVLGEKSEIWKALWYGMLVLSVCLSVSHQ